MQQRLQPCRTINRDWTELSWVFCDLNSKHNFSSIQHPTKPTRRRNKIHVSSPRFFRDSYAPHSCFAQYALAAAAGRLRRLRRNRIHEESSESIYGWIVYTPKRHEEQTRRNLSLTNIPPPSSIRRHNRCAKQCRRKCSSYGIYRDRGRTKQRIKLHEYLRSRRIIPEEIHHIWNQSRSPLYSNFILFVVSNSIDHK